MVRIAPIGQYRFRKLTRPGYLSDPDLTDNIHPQGVESSQQDLASSISTDGGDPDAAKAAWELEGDSPEPGDGFETLHLYHQLQKSDELAAIYGLKIQDALFKGKLNFSGSAMSLPEALIYIEMLEHELPNEFSFKMSLSRSLSSSQTLQTRLKLFKSTETLTEWRLSYHIKNRRISIYQNDKLTGSVQFVIRGYNIEEIQGTYKGAPILLDPIWHPTEKGKLREEHIRYKTHHLTLIYKQNEKFSVRQNRHKYQAKTTCEDRGISRQIIIKSLQVNNYQGKIRLLYLNGILSPTAIEGHFKNTP